MPGGNQMLPDTGPDDSVLLPGEKVAVGVSLHVGKRGRSFVST